MDSREKWRVAGKIVSSKTRRKIFYSLKDEKTPSDVCRETGLPSSNVSRTLRELEELGVVRCNNPCLRKGKIFKRTRKGEEIYRIVDRIKSN